MLILECDDNELGIALLSGSVFIKQGLFFCTDTKEDPSPNTHTFSLSNLPNHLNVYQHYYQYTKKRKSTLCHGKHISLVCISHHSFLLNAVKYLKEII